MSLPDFWTINSTYPSYIFFCEHHHVQLPSPQPFIWYFLVAKGWFFGANMDRFMQLNRKPPNERIDGDRHSHGCLGLSWPRIQIATFWGKLRHFAFQMVYSETLVFPLFFRFPPLTMKSQLFVKPKPNWATITNPWQLATLYWLVHPDPGSWWVALLSP